MKIIVAISALLIVSCSSSSSESDAILSQKIKDASDLVIAIDQAIYLADSYPQEAVSQLWDLCDQANAFTQSLYGTPDSKNQYSYRYGKGWQYPGDVPEKFDDALWTPIVACYLHDSIKEGQISATSEYIAQFRVGYRCLRSFICE